VISSIASPFGWEPTATSGDRSGAPSRLLGITARRVEHRHVRGRVVGDVPLKRCSRATRPFLSATTKPSEKGTA
jgi:hypothetical protein